MSICIITNPYSGSSDQADSLRKLISRQDDIVILECSDEASGDQLALRAVDEGFDIVVAAGGDGTVNAVVNGLVKADRKVQFGVVPLGTGNDLARTLSIPSDPLDAVAVLEIGRVERIDLIKAETEGETIYGINAAAGGFSGQVNEVLTPELKSSWGPLAYLIGAVTTIPDMKNHETYISYDDGSPEPIDAFNIIVANGRTVAGGRNVAPMANPQDGKLDVVIVRYGTVLKLAEVGAKLLAGNYLSSDHVTHRTAGRVHVASVPGMWFNIDGELLTNQAITLSVEPQALEVIVGDDYTPEGKISEKT